MKLISGKSEFADEAEVWQYVARFEERPCEQEGCGGQYRLTTCELRAAHNANGDPAYTYSLRCDRCGDTVSGDAD